MAVSMIPPAGEIRDAMKRREQMEREIYSPDPVERYRARESRLNEDLSAFMGELVRQARRNTVTKSDIQGVNHR